MGVNNLNMNEQWKCNYINQYSCELQIQTFTIEGPKVYDMISSQIGPKSNRPQNES